MDRYENCPTCGGRGVRLKEPWCVVCMQPMIPGVRSETAYRNGPCTICSECSFKGWVPHPEAGPNAYRRDERVADVRADEEKT